jgi:hypothetical protein
LIDLVTQPVLEALEEIPPRIIVLEQYGDPGVRLGVEDIARIDPALDLVSRAGLAGGGAPNKDRYRRSFSMAVGMTCQPMVHG